MADNTDSEVILDISQKISHHSDEILLGSFSFSTKDKEPFTFQATPGSKLTVLIPEIPFGFSIDSNQQKSNIIKIKHSDSLSFQDLKPNLDPSFKIRSLGGKNHNKDVHDYSDNRGGYQFTANKECKNLTGHAGISNEDKILSVLISFNGNKTNYRLPFLFPAGASDLFDETDISLCLNVKFGDRSWSFAGPEFKFKKYEFLNDASLSLEELNNNLIIEYGDLSKKPALHARDYYEYVNGKSDISKKFIECLDAAAVFIAGKIPKELDFSVAKLEIACTMLCEGGVLVFQNGLDNNTKPDNLRFSGYGTLGIDRYVSSWNLNEGFVRLFTPEMLSKKINIKDQTETITNESGETFTTFKELNLTEAVYAVACLYSDCKAAFAKDLKDPNIMGSWITNISDIPAHVQHFWATIYMNTGIPSGQKTLGNQGLEYHDLIWRGKDDFLSFQRMEKYNANWRIATYRLLKAQTGWE